ncbi:MAG: NAD(P)-dependent oxidoreductase [Pirellulales bacterium]|nr:NAD(P)-dependent oxidoreductase [Pirellulales bacterium]
MLLPTISPAQTRLGWIGTGVMGLSMAGHLLAKGYSLTVYSRTRAKAEPLLARGAAWGETPEAVARGSDVIFSIVSRPADVREVILGPAGTLRGAAAGSIIVDMTTSDPALAVEIDQAARTRGVHSVDAPVSGGDIGAREARLSIMIGGDADVVRALQPCFEVMGKTIVHQGGAGAGQHTKLTNQILIATNIIGVCEALLYAFKAGLNLETVMQSVAPGAAGSWSLSNYGPRIMQDNYEPGFYVEHFIKDLGLALAESQRLGLSMPGLALAQQLYIALSSQGYGRKGIQALMLGLATLSNVDWRGRHH